MPNIEKKDKEKAREGGRIVAELADSGLLYNICSLVLCFSLKESLFANLVT
jgi:hypothetical protein